MTGGQPAEGVVPGWERQWLGPIAAARQSWGLPLDLARRGPAAGTPTDLAIRQPRRTLQERPAAAPRPVVTADRHHDVAALVAATLACGLVVRRSSRRRFYRPSPPSAGKGAPRKHGPVCRTHDPATHGTPDRTQRAADPARGWVRVEGWERRHGQGSETVEVTGARVTGGRLPGAAVRWGWLWAAGVWRLWLARDATAETALPWERPQPVGPRPDRPRFVQTQNPERRSHGPPGHQLGVEMACGTAPRGSFHTSEGPLSVGVMPKHVSRTCAT